MQKAKYDNAMKTTNYAKYRINLEDARKFREGVYYDEDEDDDGDKHENRMTKNKDHFLTCTTIKLDSFE